MRNPYKKFQNSSMHVSKVMLCIKKHDERKDGQKDKCPRSNMLLLLLLSWGHNNAPNYPLYIPCFLYNHISLWCYMKVNNLRRVMSRSMILTLIFNIFKTKRRSVSSFLMKYFDFLDFLLLLREDEEEKDE